MPLPRNTQVPEAPEVSLQAEVEQANEQLRETNDFVEGILASITDPLVVHDGEWRLRYLNPAAAALLERARAVKASTVIGQSLWDVYRGVRGTPFEREIERAATERVALTVESLVSQRSEWWEMSCYPLADGGLRFIFAGAGEGGVADCDNGCRHLRL